MLEVRAHRGESLEIRFATAEFPLVHGREDRGSDGDEQESNDLKDRALIHAGKTPFMCDRTEDARRSAVVAEVEDERMPQRDLQPRSVRREEGHSNQVHVEQESEGALRS